MLSVGDRAPPFELADLEGNTRAVPYPEGPTVAVFWKPRCATCDLAFPYLQRLAGAYPSAGWQLLALSQDGAEASAEFARRHGVAMPILIEGEGWPISRLYDPEATPTMFLISPDGEIEMTGVGFSKEDLNEVSRRLGERLGVEAVLIAEEGDGNPPFKPG